MSGQVVPAGNPPDKLSLKGQSDSQCIFIIENPEKKDVKVVLTQNFKEFFGDVVVRSGTDDVTICKLKSSTDKCPKTRLPIITLIHDQGAISGPDMNEAVLVGVTTKVSIIVKGTDGNIEGADVTIDDKTIGQTDDKGVLETSPDYLLGEMIQVKVTKDGFVTKISNQQVVKENSNIQVVINLKKPEEMVGFKKTIQDKKNTDFFLAEKSYDYGPR